MEAWAGSPKVLRPFLPTVCSVSYSNEAHGLGVVFVQRRRVPQAGPERGPAVESLACAVQRQNGRRLSNRTSARQQQADR
jgi:hypothetical protein